jgi:hypothetical protein
MYLSVIKPLPYFAVHTPNINTAFSCKNELIPSDMPDKKHDLISAKYCGVASYGASVR